MCIIMLTDCVLGEVRNEVLCGLRFSRLLLSLLPILQFLTFSKDFIYRATFAIYVVTIEITQ
jgi:hypothetical protein